MELTILGGVLLSIVSLNMANGTNSKLVVGFLSVLLLSMVLLNWKQIRPIFIKDVKGGV